MAGRRLSEPRTSSISIPGFDPSKYGKPSVRRESLVQSEASTSSQQTPSSPQPKAPPNSETYGEVKVTRVGPKPTSGGATGVPPSPGGRQLTKPIQESKEEQLKRLQEDQLRRISSRVRHRGGPPPTTSLEDLELARRPLLNNHISEEPHLSPPNGNVKSATEGVTSTTSSAPRLVDEPPTERQTILESPTSVAPFSDMQSATKGNSKARNPRWATPDQLKPVLMETNSNAWGSDLASDASTADSDSMKAMRHGKLFKRQPPAEASSSLVGWDGNWQPPPVDWNDRPRFNNSSLEYRNGFNHWLNGDVEFPVIPPGTVLNLDLHPDGLGFVKFTEGINERNASKRYGFPPDVVDIVRHVARLENFEYATDWGKLDLKDSDNKRFQRETTESLVANWVAQKTQRRQHTITPHLPNHADTDSHVPLMVSTNPAPISKAPKVNIYLRPAVRTDTDQLTELYNWYVVHSPRTTDIELIQGFEMRGRLDECASAKLPFIVVVSREHRSLRRLKGAERIVGFASATDFAQSNLTERISAELEVYVHPDWIHKGVGRALLDKLLDSTDRGHLRTSTVTFTSDPDIKHLYSAGGGRDLNVLIFIVRHFKNPNAGAGEDIGALIRWLVDDFGFGESGCLKGVGTKFKRLLNMTYLTKETKWQPLDGNVPDALNTS